MGVIKRIQRRFATRQKWREWLQKNHARHNEAWLVFAKRASGKKSVRYVEAVEEAICFGWIDTTVKRLDENFYIQRFTPRTNNRNWSKINLQRFQRMEAEGLMTDAGRAKLPADVAPPRKRLSSDDPVPKLVKDALDKDPLAAKNFEGMARSYRRNYLRWVTEAKKEDTRERRLKQVLQWLRENRKRVY